MLVYKEIRVNYLTYIKDLISKINHIWNINREKWYYLDNDLTLIEIKASYLTHIKNLTLKIDYI
jgi:hypothetical protein